MERTNPYLNNIAFFLLSIYAGILMLSNAAGLIIITLVIIIWIAQTLAYRRKDWLDYPLAKPIIALIGFKVLVLLVSGFEGPFGSVLEQLTLPLVYFMVPPIVVTAERRRKIIWMFIAGATLAAGIGIIRYQLGIIGRAASIVSGPYTFSIYMAIAVGVILTMFAFSKNVGEKIFLGLVSIPALFGAFFALERAAYLVIALYVVILGFFKDRKLLVPIIVLAGIVYFFSPPTINKLKERFDYSNKKSFYSHREVLLDLGLERANKVGFFGYGINSFPALVDVQAEPRITAKGINSWHNMYMEYLLDGGPLNLLILIWLLIVQARYSFARFKKSNEPEHKVFQYTVIFVVLCLVVMGFFADTLRDPIISMLIWMMFGLSLI